MDPKAVRGWGGVLIQVGCLIHVVKSRRLKNPKTGGGSTSSKLRPSSLDDINIDLGRN